MGAFLRSSIQNYSRPLLPQLSWKGDAVSCQKACSRKALPSAEPFAVGASLGVLLRFPAAGRCQRILVDFDEGRC